MFAFTSMGGKVNTFINKGGGSYMFKMHGLNYHKISGLLPPYGEAPKFAQLYVYDTENEIANRMNAIRYEYN